MEKKNLIVGQSGGPTAVINSSLYGVVSEGIKQEEIEHVYGMINGIEGFLKGTILDFEEALPGEKLKYLTYTPGAYLGSCRYKLPESLEDPALGKPVLVMRDRTERPEGVEAGTLKLAGTKMEDIYRECRQLLTEPEIYRRMSEARNPYGDGTASIKIRKILEDIDA